MKVCSCCGLQKSLPDFQMRKASKDGYTSSCKTCLNARDSARYTKEREYRLAKHKDYMSTTEGKAAHAKAALAWREMNSLKRAAHIILGNAVKYGKVKKQLCWVCGGLAEAHHPDYSKPLDVVWLCSQHHKDTHKLSKDAP